MHRNKTITLPNAHQTFNSSFAPNFWWYCLLIVRWLCNFLKRAKMHLTIRLWCFQYATHFRKKLLKWLNEMIDQQCCHHHTTHYHHRPFCLLLVLFFILMSVCTPLMSNFLPWGMVGPYCTYPVLPPLSRTRFTNLWNNMCSC